MRTLLRRMAALSASKWPSLSWRWLLSRAFWLALRLDSGCSPSTTRLIVTWFCSRSRLRWAEFSRVSASRASKRSRRSPRATRWPSTTATSSTTPGTEASIAWTPLAGWSLPCTATVWGRGARKAQPVANAVPPARVQTNTEEVRRFFFSSTGWLKLQELVSLGGISSVPPWPGFAPGRNTSLDAASGCRGRQFPSPPPGPSARSNRRASRWRAGG